MQRMRHFGQPCVLLHFIFLDDQAWFGTFLPPACKKTTTTRHLQAETSMFVCIQSRDLITGGHRECTLMLGGNTRAWSCPLTLGSLRTDCETRWKQSLWFAWPAPSSENMPVQSEQALVTQSHTRPGAVSQWQGRHTSCYRSTNRKNDIESDHFKVEKRYNLQDGVAGGELAPVNVFKVVQISR